MSLKVKIINDPVYGFIKFPEPELVAIIDHPWFQKLRNIKQMGLAYLVYPGAMHTRFAHSLGTCHLMGKALEELKAKGIYPNKDECLGARIAALLHDIGHGPFSHSLEYELVGIAHENLSKLIMNKLNFVFNGLLDTAIQIFDSEKPYALKYLHQLVSSQMDVDRMDYLNRDSFYTGVSEGVIGYDRILQMLMVHENELIVEEKGIHSVEKFIIARRLMYWQVYLHKTVLGTEMLLKKIFKRAKELIETGTKLYTTPALSYFLYTKITLENFIDEPQNLVEYCRLDDGDILVTIKQWQEHEDKILSMLCKMLILRKLYKVILSSQSLASNLLELQSKISSKLKLSDEELDYYVFDGTTFNNTYNNNDDLIKIGSKSGLIRNITEIDDSLLTQTLAHSVHKNYICYIQC